MTVPLKCAVIGSGPSGLMVASQLSQRGIKVVVYEKYSSLGRKILVAGSSGLNVSYDCEFSEFVKAYSQPTQEWKKILTQFSPEDWLKWISDLGLETFKGTSHRYFVRDMKGVSLLKKWTESLKHAGVEFKTGHEMRDFESHSKGVSVQVREATNLEASWVEFDALALCLGGGSWLKPKENLVWPEIFKKKELKVIPFVSSNCGFKVAWPKKFIDEVEGQPLKNIILKSKKGERAGELVITKYGLEGTPIYAMGVEGEIEIDLKPALSVEQIFKKLKTKSENFSPIRNIKKNLNLSPVALALLFHFSNPAELKDLKKMVEKIKRFSLNLLERQPLSESISSSGGLSWDEVNGDLMLKKSRGVFVAGEMLDWDAPTGGFLIQGCVSSAYFASTGILKYLERLK